MEPEKELSLAQQAREDALMLAYIDEQLDVVLAARDVSPQARNRLRGLLAYYAKKRNPFRACVRDNMKRFGPRRTEAICATLKDMIRGTTKWRGERGVAGSDNYSDNYVINDEVADLLLSISDEELEKIVFNASDING
jgi:hypothetical protein